MSLLAVATLPSVTGLPQDTVTNAFAIKSPASPTSSQQTAVATAVSAFYNAVGPTVGEAVGYRMSKSISRAANACLVKVYDLDGHLDGSPHGSPLSTYSFTLTAAGAAVGLPSEVACVLRLEAVGRSSAPTESADGSDAGVTPDRPKQRRTGRVYIGPLTADAISVVSNVPRINTSFRDSLLDSGERLADAIGAIGTGWTLGVWSRSDATIRDVDYVAVDDAFDTQRRRGEKPTGITRRFIL